MPRLKRLPPKVETYPFKVKLTWVHYDFDLKGRTYKPNRVFRVGCLCREVYGLDEKLGEEFKANFVLKYEDYKNQVLRKNDILLLNDRIQWIPKGKYVYRNKDKEKILHAPAKIIKRDNYGNLYFDETVFPFTVRVGVGDWKIYERYADDIVAKLGYDKEHVIDLYFDVKEEMLSFEGGEFFVTEEEYKTLENSPNGKVYFKPIISRIPLQGSWFDIKFEVDKTLNKMIMTINKINK